MRSAARIFGPLWLLALLWGCSWGGYQVSTTPQGADVMVGGVDRGQTPVDVILHSDAETTILIRKKGFRDVRIRVTPEMKRHLEPLHFDLEALERPAQGGVPAAGPPE